MKLFQLTAVACVCPCTRVCVCVTCLTPWLLVVWFACNHLFFSSTIFLFFLRDTCNFCFSSVVPFYNLSFLLWRCLMQQKHTGEKMSRSLTANRCHPRYASTTFVLMTTFPNKELTEESQSLEEAKLANAVIVQRVKWRSSAAKNGLVAMETLSGESTRSSWMLTCGIQVPIVVCVGGGGGGASQLVRLEVVESLSGSETHIGSTTWILKQASYCA